jgi:anti-sigma factor RsiW
MQDDIALLLEFYHRSGPEVTAHNLAELEPDKAVLIQRFVAGECDDEERRELSKFLLQNPERIRWVAEQIKSGRATSSSEG